MSSNSAFVVGAFFQREKLACSCTPNSFLVKSELIGLLVIYERYHIQRNN